MTFSPPKTRPDKKRGLGRFFSLPVFALFILIYGCWLLNLAKAQNAATQPVDPTANDDAKRAIVLPTEPGDHRLKFRTHIGKRLVEMSYLLHLPPDYADLTKKHPMLVFFHGIGECGTDLAGIYALGPMTLLKKDGGNPTFAASCPFIVLCPQCPPRGQTWDDDYMYKACDQLIAQTIQKSRTDPDRVYATGLSMGGLGAWCVAENQPDLFAAIGPLSAMDWQAKTAGPLLRFVSIWCVVGNDDQPRFLDGTKSMDNAVAGAPVDHRFTYFIGNGHDAWWPAYQNPQFYEWLLEHRRPSAIERKKLDSQPLPPTTQPIPTTPGHHLLNFATRIGDQPYILDYSIYIPQGYNPSDPPRAAMLFLHEQDTIGPSYHDICMHGPDLLLESHPGLQKNFPFVVISPRLPIKCDWETPGLTPALLALIDHVAQGINIDPDRISVSGINNGAAGAWKLAMEAPNRFCSLVPILIDGSFVPRDDQGSVVNTVTGHVYVKTTENNSPPRIKNLIGQAVSGWQCTTLDESASALTQIPAYSDHAFITWLQAQRRHAKS